MSNLKNEVVHSGLFLVGKFAGFKQQSGTSRTSNQPYTLHYIGIEIPVENGFSGETRFVDVQVSTSLINSGLMNKLQPLIGKTVSCAVYVRAYPTRGGAGFGFNLSNNLLAVTEVEEVKSKVQ